MITAKQREARRQYIGSSDSAAVIGVDPFRNAMDVWLDKTGKLEGDGGNEHTDRGTWLEPGILSFAEHKIGCELDRDIMKIHPSKLLAANFDAIVRGRNEIVEAKSSVAREEWGDEGTDQVPEHVLVQVHHQFAVAGPEFRVCWVPVVLPGFKSFDFRLYRIERNQDLAEMVETSGEEFMKKYVKTDTPPDGLTPSLEVIQRIRRVPNKTVQVESSLVEAWRLAADAKIDAERALESAKLNLLAAIGDAEAAECQLGSITYMEQQRKEYVVKASSYRVLRFKRAK